MSILSTEEEKVQKRPEIRTKIARLMIDKYFKINIHPNLLSTCLCQRDKI